MLFLSVFLCVGNYAQAERKTVSTSTEQQTGTCTGVVKDAKGETLPGASVIVKDESGSSAMPIGTTTGIDGDFTINNIPVGSTLVISFRSEEHTSELQADVCSSDLKRCQSMSCSCRCKKHKTKWLSY